MGRRNPVAKALRKLKHKVIPNKKKEAKEAWHEQDDPTYCPGCGNELMYCVCWDGRS